MSNSTPEEEEEGSETEKMSVGVEKVQRMCASNAHKSEGVMTKHTKEDLGDGWTKYVCSSCGQVKFAVGEEVERD
jgi:hypothetical protein